MSEIKFEKVSLRKLVKIKNGKDHQELKTGIYPVYGSGGIIRYVDKYMYDKESILLPRKGSLNNIQFASKPFWTVDTCYYTEVNEEKVLPYYLFKILSRYDIEMLNTGSAVPSMTFEKYYSIEIKLPSKNYQTKVVNQLKSYDNLIENNQKQIKLLEEAAQRLYKEWFVNLRFPGHENVKIIDGVPEGWEKKCINALGKITTGKTPSTSKTEYYGGEYPFIKIPDMHNCIFPLLTESTLTLQGVNSQKNKTIHKNSIMVSCIATVGLVNIATQDCQTNQQINSLELTDTLNLYYMYFTLKRLKDLLEGVGSNGATMTNVNKEKFGKLAVMLPCKHLIEQFYNFCHPIFTSIYQKSVEEIKLKEARDRLLPKLMSGEIEL
jgi:type I restriction enzyme S subunit